MLDHEPTYRARPNPQKNDDAGFYSLFKTKFTGRENEKITISLAIIFTISLMAQSEKYADLINNKIVEKPPENEELRETVLTELLAQNEIETGYITAPKNYSTDDIPEWFYENFKIDTITSHPRLTPMVILGSLCTFGGMFLGLKEEFSEPVRNAGIVLSISGIVFFSYGLIYQEKNVVFKPVNKNLKEPVKNRNNN